MADRPEVGTICLVHGAFHGAWCWAKLVPELEQREFRCVAVDLPIDDPEAGASEYADVVVTALQDVEEPVAIVGHSMAGVTIPIVATRRPVAQLVYLCSPLPNLGESIAAGLEPNEEMNSHVIANDDGTLSWPIEPAIEFFYPDCTREDALWAARRLRPQALRPVIEVTPLERWPEADSTYILCTADRVVSPPYARQIALERLGRRALELSGSHSPMIARPAELADLLTRVVRTAEPAITTSE